MDELLKIIELAKKLKPIVDELMPLFKALEESDWETQLAKWEQVRAEGHEESPS